MIDLINKYFNAVNYLSVAQLFLKNNFFLKRKLVSDDVKDIVFGHWGCSPGINFIYSHLQAYMNKEGENYHIVFGTGHASAAVYSNLIMSDVLQIYYPKYNNTIKGIGNLIHDFGTSKIFRTEISMAIPYITYSGGELGNAVAHSFGSVLKQKNKTVFCILGDGEMEAGCNLQSFFCNHFISSNNDGFPVFIINFNQYKMASRSLMSLCKDKNKIFQGFGYNVFECDGSHKDMFFIMEKISKIKKEWQNGEKVKIPIVIVKTLKGWTGPKIIGNDKFEGNYLSHKVSILKKPKKVDNYIEILSEWLLSYNPKNLFLNKNNFNKLRNFASNNNLNSYTSSNLDRFLNKINLKFDYRTPMKTVENYLSNYIENIDNDFIICSPDEGLSNGIGNIINKYALKIKEEDISTNLKTSEFGNVIEILNENSCINILIGYLMSGKDGAFITYEAFAPIIASNISQFYKNLLEIKKYTNKQISSLKIILTSLGWRNTYTHQNPDLLNTLLSKDSNFCEIYFPIMTKQIPLFMDKMFKLRNKICVLHISKHVLKNNDLKISNEEILSSVEKGFFSYKILEAREIYNKQSIILVTIGDVMFQECLKAVETLKKKNICPRSLEIKIISILNSKIMEDIAILSEIEKEINANSKVLFYCTGYTSIFKGLASSYFDIRNWKFFGYNDALGKDIEVLKNNLVANECILDEIYNFINNK